MAPGGGWGGSPGASQDLPSPPTPQQKPPKKSGVFVGGSGGMEGLGLRRGCRPNPRRGGGPRPPQLL